MDSQHHRGTENHDKITSEIGGTSHCKTNSHYAETKTERGLSDEGAPDRRRGRSADRCCQVQSLGSPGCHHDPCRLPPWSAVVRACRPVLESNRFHARRPARAEGQEGHACHPSRSRRRNAGPAQVAAGAGSKVAVRVHQRAGVTVHDGGLCAHGGARWCRGQAGLSGSSSHAAPRLWLCTGQQGPRYPSVAGLPRPPQHPAHGGYTGLSPGRFKYFWR